MEISIFTHPYMQKTLSETLDILKSMDVFAAEVGSGGYVGKSHCDPQLLLANEDALKDFRDLFNSRGMKLSCLSVHGNPLHPCEETARQHHDDLIATIDLAALLGLDTVVTFSGCPGDNDDAKYPNWCFYPWPLENQDILEYQWEKKLIPYWKQIGVYAAEKGIRVALELQASACVYTPATLLRLREETGQKSLGANIDPSHLWWQGIDPVSAIQILGDEDCIFFFHAKDTSINKNNMNASGALDPQSFIETRNRAWLFRSIGYGHGLNEWAEIISTLRAVGYDGYISVEHEDALMSQNEGLRKGLKNIYSVIMEEPAAIPSVFLKK